ncbi:MAG: prepilin-type N-terminal cleavage/methylation domain-containing protein [Planctomycetes bacterium]|nr:prepilin-type N-terminal cleavage/methylation domain-containing protein [Planctomycetota bacterium]
MPRVRSSIHPRNPGGFTLLEILIALMILSVGLTSVILLFSVGTSSHKRGIDATASSFLAQAVFSEWKERLANGAPVDLPHDLKAQSMEGFPQPYSYDLHLEAIDPEGVEIFCRIVVRWKKAGEEETEQFTSVLLRRRIEEPRRR